MTTLPLYRREIGFPAGTPVPYNLAALRDPYDPGKLLKRPQSETVVGVQTNFGALRFLGGAIPVYGDRNSHFLQSSYQVSGDEYVAPKHRENQYKMTGHGGERTEDIWQDPLHAWALLTGGPQTWQDPVAAGVLIATKSFPSEYQRLTGQQAPGIDLPILPLDVSPERQPSYLEDSYYYKTYADDRVALRRKLLGPWFSAMREIDDWSSKLRSDPSCTDDPRNVLLRDIFRLATSIVDLDCRVSRTSHRIHLSILQGAAFLVAYGVTDPNALPKKDLRCSIKLPRLAFEMMIGEKFMAPAGKKFRNMGEVREDPVFMERYQLFIETVKLYAQAISAGETYVWDLPLFQTDPVAAV